MVIEPNGKILEETYIGYVETIEDANILLRACEAGELPFATQCPLDDQLHPVCNGYTFVYGSGTEKGDDGKKWDSRPEDHDFVIQNQGSGTGRLIKRLTCVEDDGGYAYFVVCYYKETDVNEEQRDGYYHMGLRRPSQDITLAYFRRDWFFR